MTSSVINELIKKKISKSSGLDKGEKRKYCSAPCFWDCPPRCHGSVMSRMCAANHLLIFISRPSSRSWQGPVWKSWWINNDFLDCWGLCNRARGLCILNHDDTSNQYANYQTSYWRRYSRVFSLPRLWKGPSKGESLFSETGRGPCLRVQTWMILVILGADWKAAWLHDLLRDSIWVWVGSGGWARCFLFYFILFCV